jgi:tRNA-modifying protein YgfZ
LRFVNGQITNDIAKATERSAIAACVLTAKGKVNAFVFVSAQPDHLLLDADAEVRELLPARLERYVISDDVQIEDVTERFSLFHVLAQPTPGLAGIIISANRFGEAGFDIWTDGAQHDPTRKVIAAEWTLCDEQCAEIVRIERGIPRWGSELNEEIIPVEANLESTTIDYAKGCYIGQEVISRMKMSGQRNKGLYGVIAQPDVALVPGLKLFSKEGPKKEAGWITSATWSDRLGKRIALGYLKRPFNHPGAVVETDPGQGEPMPVQIVNLPFESIDC